MKKRYSRRTRFKLETNQSKSGNNETSDISNNITRYFLEDNKGPFTIWIQPMVTDNNGQNQIKSLSPFKVGNLICKKYKDILYICSKTKSRVEVNFKNPLEANKLLNDNDIKDNNLKAYIPGFRLSRRGIIKGIDEDISEEEILENIESRFKVLKVRRLNRRNRDPCRKEEDPKWVASKSVVLTFSGQMLPSEIYISRVKVKVDSYMILPVICYNCFKIGHTSSNCKNNAKCSMCAEIKHDGSCTSGIPTCSNCKSDHISTNKKCPVYCREYEVRRLMAYENISMGDARKLVFPEIQKSFRTGTEDFPHLRDKLYTPCNEVVKGQKRQLPHNNRDNANRFYKLQSEKCENFIGSRELHQGPMGVALPQKVSASQGNVDNNDKAKNQNQQQKIGIQTKKYQTQLPILRDTSNCTGIHPTAKEDRSQLSKSQIDPAKITRTYARANKELNIRQTSDKENEIYINTQPT